MRVANRFYYKILLTAALFSVLFSGVAGAETNSVDSVQEAQGTVRGAMRMYLYEEGTELTDKPNNNIHVTLGDTIAIVVWLNNFTQEHITALSLYYTADDKYLRPVPLNYYSDGNFQVFNDGYFMEPANPQKFPIISNYAHNDKVSANDNGEAGWQLDYLVYAAPPAYIGGEQKYSNYAEGEACRFYFIATGVCDSLRIDLDDNHNDGRFSRYSIQGSNDTYSFRTYNSCYITISGLQIEPPIPDLFMEPGTVDSTSIDLDRYVTAGSIPDSLFSWSATGNTNIGVLIHPLTHQVTFTTPIGFRGYEDITFTVYNEDDPELDTDTMRVNVGYRPRLLKDAIPDTITIYEDSTHVAVLYLPDIVQDVDNVFSTLTWAFTTKGGNVTPEKVNTVLNLRGRQDFFGKDTLYIHVEDDMKLADNDTVLVRVLPVNDAPVIAGLPDAVFERTKSCQFDLSEYANDVDNDPLQVSWGSPAHFFVEADGMNITITEVEGYLGSENIIFTVRDPGGLADSDTMTVSVVPLSLAPVWSKIPKIGFAQGGKYTGISLWDYVEDPDGNDNELTFTFANHDDVDSIYVNPANGVLSMWDLDNRIGWDWIYVTVSDYDLNTATTRFLVFIAPSDGTPIVGALPDTTMRAGRTLDWVDLDDYYYDIDNTDGQMKWTWSRIESDSLVYAVIHNLFRTVKLYTYNPDSTGIDNLLFTVTDPDGKHASDDALITVLGETKPLLDMPAKIGFVTGDRVVIDLDNYAEDPDFPKADLVWRWWGNTNIQMGVSTTDTTLSRPFYFTSANWIGWEKTFFEVRNPLGGAATDSTIVFSVDDDGSPLAGGLEYVYVRAGKCDSMNIDLDDFYYDDDTLDWGVTWTVTGNDSILVTIDPVTHRAQFCSPSETFEGQEVITLTVSDGEHQSSMDVAVIVYGAVYRNVFTLNVFRNPMQGDYMDFYLESSRELYGIPAVEVRVESDTTKVKMTAIGAGNIYYHGQYLLPYASSLGLQRDAQVIANGQTKTAKAVEDTLSFTYGRLGASGGKLALGKLALEVPAGALSSPVTVTIVPGADDSETADGGGVAEKTSAVVQDELIFSDVPYTVGPAALATEKPMHVSFDLCCRADGAGIYRLTQTGWEYMHAATSGNVISAETSSAGTYRLAFDRTAPVVTLVSSDRGAIVFAAADGGSGVDPATIRVVQEDETLSAAYNPLTGAFTVTPSGFYQTASVRLDIAIADRSGNYRTMKLETVLEQVPGQFVVEQNLPNPFNPRTVIPFAITSDGHVRIEVYDILGRLVCVLADTRFAAGTHTVAWDARDSAGRPVSSGVYVYRVSAGARMVTKKMVLMR